MSAARCRRRGTTKGTSGSVPAPRGWVLHQLQRVHLLRRDDPYLLFRVLLITFGVLDNLLPAQDDGCKPPTRRERVYLPLMPLDLILTKFDQQLRGRFKPYRDH
jgi:hypothetical protein